MTRRWFATLFPGLAAAQTVTVITPCAPVLNKMPKPCNGQCPACGEMHGPIQPVMVRNADNVDVPLEFTSLRDCTHCRNAFWQDVERQ